MSRPVNALACMDEPLPTGSMVIEADSGIENHRIPLASANIEIGTRVCHDSRPSGHHEATVRSWDRLGCRLTAEAGETVCMASEADHQTLAGAIDELARRGFTESFSVVGNRLRVVETQKTFRPEDVVVREYRRFEGVSDPDDMAIVYAIETEGRIRGTLVDAYGVYSDPAVSAFLETVRILERHR